MTTLNFQKNSPLFRSSFVNHHAPVLLAECLDALAIKPGGTYADATFGRGGHSVALLARLPADARLLVIDRDMAAVAAARELARQDPRVQVIHARFSEIAAVLADVLDGTPVQCVLMDVGVSSPQLDTPERGFSFAADGPLDMRMDTSSGVTAAQWLEAASEDEIASVLRRFGEERYARRIARAIVAAPPLVRTAELAELVRASVPAPRQGRSGPQKHVATRTFQALRIQVNSELEELEQGLQGAFESLAGGGRLLVISFHSLEDRLVKQTFRRWTKGPQLPRRLPVRDIPAAPARSIAGPVRAGAAEVAGNPRARSATLRVIERVA